MASELTHHCKACAVYVGELDDLKAALKELVKRVKATDHCRCLEVADLNIALTAAEALLKDN